MKGGALIHINKRKRQTKKVDDYVYPTTNPKINFLDKLVTIIGVLIPLSAIPQIIKVWVTKNSADISLLTWSLFLISTFPLLIYGIVHKEKPLITMYALWIIVHSTMVFSILYWR